MKIDMRQLILDEANTAHNFANDGAYFTAADILRSLADRIQKHAEQKRLDMDALVAGDFDKPLIRARREIAALAEAGKIGPRSNPQFAREVIAGLWDDRNDIKTLREQYETQL